MALAAGILGHSDIVAAAAALWAPVVSKDVDFGRPAAAGGTRFLRESDRRIIHSVVGPLCSSVKTTRESSYKHYVSRVVADRAVTQPCSDMESSRSSGLGGDENGSLLVTRENYSGAVESEDFKFNEEDEKRPGQVEETKKRMGRKEGSVKEVWSKSGGGEGSLSKNWKDKLREDEKRKNNWWSDDRSIRVCMAEQIVAKLHSSGGKGANLNSLLAPFAGKVSVRVATLVFKRAFIKSSSEALRFYTWLGEHHNKLDVGDVNLLLPMYYSIIQCLIQGRQWVDVERVVCEMEGKKICPPDAGVYRKIIKAASGTGNSKIANKWLQSMLANGFSPNLPTWNVVLGCYAREGRVREVFAVHEQLKACGYVADRVTYCALLSACRNAGRVHEARTVLSEMKSRGVEPNRIVYSVLVDLYGKAGFPDSAAATFREMEKAGYQPDQVAYNTLIHAFVKAGMVDEANNAFERALKLGRVTDPVIFSTMINMYTNVGLVEAALDLLQIMKKYGFEKKHYQYAYATLINAYARVRQLRQAIELFEEMKSGGYPIGDSVFATMLNVYFKVGRHRCAEDLFQEMIRKGNCRNVVAVGTMINIYGRMGRLEEAVQIFDSLKASGFRGNTVIYNTLIYCQGTNGNCDAVEEYVREMKSASLELDRVTYSSLIKAYNHAGRPGDAIRTYEEMRSAGVGLDKLVVGAMVNIFGKLRRYEEVLFLLEETRQKRIWPDERLLRSVIDVYDSTQLEDCSPDTFSRLGELVIAMEQAVNRGHKFNRKPTCIDNYEQIGLLHEAENEFFV